MVIAAPARRQEGKEPTAPPAIIIITIAIPTITVIITIIIITLPLQGEPQI